MGPFARFLLATSLLLVYLAITPVAAQDVTSPTFGEGETFSHTFPHSGKAKFHCHPHGEMGFGDITIEPASLEDPQTHQIDILDGEKGYSFSTLEMTINAGDTVEWVNIGKGSHQIMAWISEDGDPDVDHDHPDHGHDAHESPVGPVLPLLGGLGLVAFLRRR